MRDIDELWDERRRPKVSDALLQGHLTVASLDRLLGIGSDSVPILGSEVKVRGAAWHPWLFAALHHFNVPEGSAESA